MSELADRPVRVPDEIFLLHWWRLILWFSNLRLVPRWYEHRSRFLLRLFRRLYYDGLTRSGKVILISSCFIFLTSYRSSSEFLLFTTSFGISLLLWASLLGYIYRPNISVLRETPNTAVAGELLSSKIRITNTGRFNLYNFSLREMVVPSGRWPREWSRPHQKGLRPGHSVTVSVLCEPRRRGVFSLSGIAVVSYFPFFLTRFTSREALPTDVYVLPETLRAAIPSLRNIADQASKRLIMGSENTRKGPSLDYAYSRPYQTGDSMRRLDHRASSRYGEPMSKVFEGVEQIRRDKVYLIVDLSLADFTAWQRRPTDEDPLDERLALAVEIGRSAQNEGFSLSALATGSDWHTLENPLQFYQHIATCSPQRGYSEELNTLPDSVLLEEGIHVLVLGRWTEKAEALVNRCQQAGILMLVFLIAESADHLSSLPVGKQFIEIPTSLSSTASLGTKLTIRERMKARLAKSLKEAS
ncbi:MAG: hypothetical protein DHS20C12_25180 [Pseudohongiella sp.]|nr:MAG: hypothetical protein DHS20C12_25180 [Pseudohongiella sp.]